MESQEVEDLRRQRPADTVAAEDDRVHDLALDVGEHRLERRAGCRGCR